MLFREVIGHEAAKQRIIHSIRTGQVAHAQLLVGAEGVGALPLALALAQYLHCTDPQKDDACGKCPSCLKHNKLSHPDLHLVFPIVKKEGSSRAVICDDYIHDFRGMIQKTMGYFSLSQWTEELGVGDKQPQIYANEGEEIFKKLSYRAHEAEYKVMVVWLPERMNESCANKILKILEEPEGKTLFLFVSEDSELLLPTITSRLQRTQLSQLKEAEIVQALTERTEATADEARHAAHLAMGSYLNALEVLKQNESTQLFLDTFMQFFRTSYGASRFSSADKKFEALSSLLELTEEIVKWGRERQKHYLQYAQHQIRENYIANLAQPELNYMSEQEEAFSSRFSAFVNDNNIEALYKEYGLAQRHIEQNVSAKMVFADLALKTIMIFKQ